MPRTGTIRTIRRNLNRRREDRMVYVNGQAIPDRRRQLHIEAGDRPSRGGNRCACGCGHVPSKGARFLPGHDSKLRGNIMAVERGNIRLNQLPAGQRRAVERELAATAAA